MKAAIIGGGVIGGGWAARFLLNGWNVSVFDPDPEAERKISEVLKNARRSLPELYDKALPNEGLLSFHDSIESAVSEALWIQESIPERLELKTQLFTEIQNYALPNAIIGSSTSGFKPSELQQGSIRAEQILVAHPFNPVYLLPLIELVPSANTSPEITGNAKRLLATLGMKPLIVRKEIDAHIADRFLEAVWREALWLIDDGIATTEEIDDAIRFGFGLRWAQMGLFETYRIAGGEAGMKHFIEQFGPCLKWPWTKLMDVPELSEALIDKISTQSDEQSGALSIRELERLRDDNLVGIIRTLKRSGSGAGGVINTHEKGLSLPEGDGLLITASRQIPQSWTDYNGHMNESRYLEASSEATDYFLRLIGVNADYVAKGGSYFTVETHIRHIDEVCAHDPIYITTQVLLGEGKKLHLFNRIHHGSGRLLATAEHMLIHVSLNTRSACLPGEFVALKLKEYASLHSTLEVPEGAGRAIAQKL